MALLQRMNDGRLRARAPRARAWLVALALTWTGCDGGTSTPGQGGSGARPETGGGGERPTTTTTTTKTASGMGGSGGDPSGSGGATTGSGGAGGATTGSGGSGGATTGSGGDPVGSGGATTGTGGAAAGSGGSGGTGGASACPGGCDDGVFCNGVEICVSGACVAGIPPSCDDGISCTTDTCDPMMDACAHAPVDAVCDDAIACTGAEICNPLLGCLSLGASCDDGYSCTNDFCDLVAGACAHTPSDTACDDGLFCDGVETCDPAVGDPMTGCTLGAPIDCSEGIACTADACNEATDTCDHVPQSGACDDGLLCNGAEVCVLGFGCQSGQALDCDDGLACTTDACVELAGGCAHAVNNAACSDGLDCNGQETCSLMGPAPSGCVAGTPIPCPSDGIACTIDACDEATNACAHATSNALCAPGQLCVAGLGCSAAPPCSSDGECNDGDACNGVETCNLVCQPGQPVNCDDGVGCTVDACNPATGMCSHVTNQAFCDDGLACNGIESCDAMTGCVAGTPPLCSDGVACTVDSCVEPAGTCAHAPNDDLCSDNQLCNGFEVCTPSGCAAGTPYVCPSDGIACTADACDPVANACKYTADNTLCPCGQTCSPANGGCGNFCQVSTCQGKVYACGDCLDNDNDCAIDSADTQCLGPCDNTEDSFFGGIPGQNNSPCKSDCYFDQDTGSGNDDCYWSHKCDPLEVAPNYPPEGSQCAYNPNANIPGYGGSCASAFAAQSSTCLGYCGPLTPNGCDCFGCCEIPGAPTTVWLGSENPSGVGSCTLANLNDPTKCKPCTQVQACLNTCDVCEICIGKPTLPPGCTTQDCPPGAQLCGQPGQEPCSAGFTCITGCCQANPN